MVILPRQVVASRVNVLLSVGNFPVKRRNTDSAISPDMTDASKACMHHCNSPPSIKVSLGCEFPLVNSSLL